MEYLKQFQNYIGNNDLPSIVSLWQEYCLSDEVDPEEVIEILSLIQNSPLAESFGIYVEQFLMLFETLPEGDNKHKIFSLIFDIQTTNDKKLADLAIDYLKKRYPNDEQYAQKLKLVGLREKVNFQGAIRNYDLLTHMKVGNFFIHTGGWGVGEVMDVSMLREEITLEFDFVAGNKELSFENAFKNLIPISKDHFLARRFGSPEEFEEFAKKKPVETIRMLLKDLGPKTALEIKDEMCDLVIPEEEWAKWWQTTRTKIKKDTFIESPTNLKDPFVLRKAEVSHVERFQKAVASKPDVPIFIEMVYSFLRDFPQSLKNEEFKESLKKQVIDILSQKEIHDADEIQLLFILQDLGHEKAKNLEEMIKMVPKPEEILSQIDIIAYKKRILGEIKKAREDWDVILSNLFFSIDQNTIRDYLLEELISGKKEPLLCKKIEEMLVNPTLSPSGFLWYFQKIMTSPDLPYADTEGRNRFFEAFFVLLYAIESKPELRDLVKKMLSFITSGRYENVRKIFQTADIDLVKEILLLCTKCQSLTAHDIKIFHSLAEVVHPSLAKLRKEPIEEEHILWTTEEGYKKIKDRIEQIATVETVENAKEVEVARSHGDLRENSEYKFALEKRSRLQSELKFLSDQIKQMRILTKVDIDTSKVSTGTIVKLKSDKGEILTYTLLGPFDTDPERNIISFQSKLAKSLEGLTVGSHCKIQDTDYEVVSITSYLET